MTHDLPAAIRAALARLAEGRRIASLKARHADVSGHYRAGGASSAVIDTDEAVAAYALARMPATYAAARHVLLRLVEACPECAPQTALDIGCGPGTALIAALDAFPTLRSIAGIDHSPLFLRLAATLLDETGIPAGAAARLLAGDMTATAAAPADLVLCSYALVELADPVAAATVERAWALTRQLLILVEPGSRAGFARIKAARKALIAAGATILAPCTHQAACPMADPDWCHFPVRVQRSREHRLLKGGEVPFEDEKFSYLIATRAIPALPGVSGRIIAPPERTKAGITLSLCSGDGLADRVFRARDKADRVVRKLAWGDELHSQQDR